MSRLQRLTWAAKSQLEFHPPIWLVRALAELLRCLRTTVHKIMMGQRRMDPIEFLDWCEVLEFDDPVKLIRSV